MSTPKEWLRKAGTRAEGGKGLYEEEKLWVDRLGRSPQDGKLGAGHRINFHGSFHPAREIL
jgi:hypothetical protein